MSVARLARTSAPATLALPEAPCGTGLQFVGAPYVYVTAAEWTAERTGAPGLLSL